MEVQNPCPGYINRHLNAALGFWPDAQAVLTALSILAASMRRSNGWKFKPRTNLIYRVCLTIVPSLWVLAMVVGAVVLTLASQQGRPLARGHYQPYSTYESSVPCMLEMFAIGER